MEHTWQSNHLPQVEISRIGAGDVAICGSAPSRTPLLPQLGTDRVAFVAPLGSRADLEWLLRGLHLHPNVRHLVLCGEDPKAVGQALAALWKEGLGERGQIPGARGLLSQELDAPSIDALRSDVQILDLRGAPVAELATAIRELPSLTAAREPRALPHPQIPERKVFLSRKTTFPIFSSDVGDSWLQLLNLALRIGTEEPSRNGERRAEALNAIVSIETPVLEDGAEEAREDFPDYLDFSRDDFERFYLPRHGARLRDWQGVNQLEAVRACLKESPGARSGTMILAEPAEIADGTAPDLMSATFNVVGRQLFASFVLRSSDIYTDWPLEATALVRLQRDLAEHLGLHVGTATFIVHAAHLEERDFARAARVLEQSFKRPLPLHVDPSGVFLFGNDGGKARAMLLNHDASEILWEDAFSDPEDLSWYIVDVMPWLLPQHIRYVGQECASLMRAMRESECYLQG
jgi:thymidylate synthase